MSDPGGPVPPKERRKTRRRPVLFSGLVFVPETHTTLDCSIKDISQTGARIEIQSDAPVQTRFFLINVKNSVAYDVQSVRRTGREIGLKMLRSIPLSEASDPEARQLRRLLVERLHR